MQRLVAAALQFSVEPMAVHANLERGHRMALECSEHTRARLMVFPESFTTGFTPVGGREALWRLVDTIPGRLTDIAIEWARELDAYLVFPTYERGPDPGVLFNSAALVGPEGLIGVYRKTHPFPSERIEGGGWTTPGSQACCLQTPIGRIGIVICYDGDFPELARVTALQGAHIICRPSAFMRPFDQWDLTNRARAYDNHVYWIAANGSGRDASGAHLFGSSMIVHPSGHRLATAGSGDEFVWAELDEAPLRTIVPGSSRPHIVDHLEDRNLAAYEGLLEPGRSAFEPAQRVPYARRRRTSVPASTLLRVVPDGDDLG